MGTRVLMVFDLPYAVKPDYDFAAARYLSNGQLDATFGIDGKVSTDFGQAGFDRARSAVLQADGRIVAAGFATTLNGGHENFAAVRYGADDGLDLRTILRARNSEAGGADEGHHRESREHGVTHGAAPYHGRFGALDDRRARRERDVLRREWGKSTHFLEEKWRWKSMS